MKRLHIHISVDALEPSIAFYSALFGTEPTVLKDDYAKWEVEDPNLNLAISEREGHKTGLNHLGIQASTADELDELHQRLAKAEIASAPEEAAHCCYATGNKHWSSDPSAITWEMFHTMGEAATYGADDGPQLTETPAPTAAPAPRQSQRCC